MRIKNILFSGIFYTLVAPTLVVGAGCSSANPETDAEPTGDAANSVEDALRRRRNTGGTSGNAGRGGTAGAATGGTTSSTGGATSSTGGATSNTGGTTSNTGGTTSNTGGTTSNTGGTTSNTGGTTSSTGGSTADTGGTTSSAGGTTSAAGAAPTTVMNRNTPMGTNLGEVTDYSQDWAFVDVMKSSREWISGTDATWNDGRPLTVDANGWVTALAPGQIAKTLMLVELNGQYPLGQYIVLYEGKGSLRYSAGARKNAASRAGRDVLDVGSGGIILEITAVDASDPLRNIRVIMPGGVCSNDAYRACDASNACSAAAACTSFESNHAQQIFHPRFLDRIKTYSPIRFMDWGRTNDSPLRSWSERPKVSDVRYTTARGVPLEIMLELSNRLAADPWLTLPHLADDAYVAAYAQLLGRNLAAGRKAYVEHSNEVWNGMFTQAKYAATRGAALGLSGDAFSAQLLYHAKRSVEMFKIFERELGGTERLVRVMAAQASNAWTSSKVLELEGAAANTDALAIAPYFGGELGTPEVAGAIRGFSADQLVDYIAASSLPRAISWMRDNASVAATHGVRLIAYEGGQHLAGVSGEQDSIPLNALFDATNRHPRMKGLYTTYLEGWRQSAGQEFAHYVNCGTFSKWGRWGALEHQQQARTAAPKFDAIQSFIETNPRWW